MNEITFALKMKKYERTKIFSYTLSAVSNNRIKNGFETLTLRTPHIILALYPCVAWQPAI